MQAMVAGALVARQKPLTVITNNHLQPQGGTLNGQLRCYNAYKRRAKDSLLTLRLCAHLTAQLSMGAFGGLIRLPASFTYYTLSHIFWIVSTDEL